MRGKQNNFLTILIAAAVAIGVSYIYPSNGPAPQQTPQNNQDAAFEKIMSTRELRCGYYVFPPVTYRDPNTNELSGFTIDMMNEIGKRAGVKIIWAEETDWTTWTEAMKAGRYDVACTPNWPDIPLASGVSFGTPMFFAGLYPMVRADDPRFKNESTILKTLNSPDVTFSAAEGDGVDTLIQAQFPNAKLFLQPRGSALTNFVMDLLTKKADAILTDQNGKIEFNRAHANKFKLVTEGGPVKIQPFALAVNNTEEKLKNWLDTAVLDLIYDGTMDRLLRKWEPEPGLTYLRVNSPYKN